METQTSSVSIAALSGGDESAWSEAYLPLMTAIRSVLLSRLRSGFGIDIDDAASRIVAEQIMPGLRDGRPPSFAALKEFDDLLRLARAIAARRAVDLLRSLGRRKEDPLNDVTPQNLTGAFLPDAFSEEGFWEIVNQLDPPKPELFADRFIGGMNHQEIADARGMPVGTVCSHFKRGIDALRVILSKTRAIS